MEIFATLSPFEQIPILVWVQNCAVTWTRVPDSTLHLIRKRLVLEMGQREQYFTFEQIIGVVRGHPGLERDRQLMIRALAKAYKVTPEEYAAWFNYANLEPVKGPLPPEPVRGIQAPGNLPTGRMHLLPEVVPSEEEVIPIGNLKASNLEGSGRP